MKMKYLMAVPALAWCLSANAGLFGISLSSPKKDAAGATVEAELPNPYSEFIVLDEAIFENEQLSEIPGRLVAIAENDKGTTILIPYAEFIVKDEAKTPEIKVSEFNYDSYLIDTKSALKLGVPIAAAQLDGNYKVEYRFYKGATSRISLHDIDRTKFNELAQRVRADIAQQGNLKLKSIRIVSAAATLHSAYAVLQGVKADSSITGPGWQLGGNFYSSQQMTRNRVKVGVSLVPYTENAALAAKPSVAGAPKPTDLALPNNLAIPVKPESLGISKGAFQTILKIEK